MQYITLVITYCKTMLIYKVIFYCFQCILCHRLLEEHWIWGWISAAYTFCMLVYLGAPKLTQVSIPWYQHLIGTPSHKTLYVLANVCIMLTYKNDAGFDWLYWASRNFMLLIIRYLYLKSFEIPDLREQGLKSRSGIVIPCRLKSLIFGISWDNVDQDGADENTSDPHHTKTSHTLIKPHTHKSRTLLVLNYSLIKMFIYLLSDILMCI